MGKKHGRRPKAIIPPSLPKVRVLTRDSACSPVPELINEVVPHAESTGKKVSRSLPGMKVVHLNRTETKSAKMEFVATRVNEIVSVTAAPVEILFSAANLKWEVSLVKETADNGNFTCCWGIEENISANQWKVVASLVWKFSGAQDRKGLDWVQETRRFDSDTMGLVWNDVNYEHWGPLVTIPANDNETVHTVLDVNLTLTVKEMFGFRLRDKFFYDFSEPSKDCDLVFQFTDGNLYINCAFLSVHSDYFSATRDRLSEMKTDEDGFPFEKMDVKMEEFAQLMQFVYPSKCKVTDDNVFFILPLAARFLFEGVLRKCEKFLMSELSQTEIFLKLYWASEYTMSDLQSWCFAQFKTQEEINEVQESEYYEEMKKSAKIMTALYEKMAQLTV